MYAPPLTTIDKYLAEEINFLPNFNEVAFQKEKIPQNLNYWTG